jgi:hypothetical protein
MGGVVTRGMRLLGLSSSGEDAMVREAAWLARCVGRGEWAPLFEGDITELGQRLERVRFDPGALVFSQGTPRMPSGCSRAGGSSSAVAMGAAA